MAEAVIIEAVRTPIARGKPIVGELSGVSFELHVFDHGTLLLEESNLQPGHGNKGFEDNVFALEGGADVIDAIGHVSHVANGPGNG